VDNVGCGPALGCAPLHAVQSRGCDRRSSRRVFCNQSAGRGPLRVKRRKAQCEHKVSAVHPTTDMRRLAATLAGGLRITPAFAERSKVESRRRSQPGGGFFMPRWRPCGAALTPCPRQASWRAPAPSPAPSQAMRAGTAALRFFAVGASGTSGAS
jgi:hypothetical protein